MPLRKFRLAMVFSHCITTRVNATLCPSGTLISPYVPLMSPYVPLKSFMPAGADDAAFDRQPRLRQQLVAPRALVQGPLRVQHRLRHHPDLHRLGHCLQQQHLRPSEGGAEGVETTAPPRVSIIHFGLCPGRYWISCGRFNINSRFNLDVKKSVFPLPYRTNTTARISSWDLYKSFSYLVIITT